MVRLLFRSAVALLALTLFSPAAGAHANQPSPSGDPRVGYALVLVDTSSKAELARARDLIVSQGGRVAIMLPPHAIMGWIAPDVDSRILGRYGIRSIHRSPIGLPPSGFADRETQIAINAFNDIASGRSARRRLRESRQETGPEAGRPGMIDCALPRPPINKDEFIRNLRLLGAEQSVLGIQSTITPQFASNSDVMDGSVAVAIFLVESAGGVDPNIYSWSQADQDIVRSQVIDGLNWWVEQSRAFNLARPLQFTPIFFDANNPACQISYEPVIRPGSDAPVWVNQIMSNLGATGGNVFERVAAFDRVIRDQNHANWAYTMFVAYNPSPAPTSFTDGRSSWAYIGGPYVVSLFRSFGWSISRIATHEAGHIFYACDEYFQPGYQICSCTCAPEVRPEASNGNCQDLSCTRSSTECMMRLNELALCPFTVAQIGWTSAVPKPAPTAPNGLVASATSPTQVNLVWQDTSGVEDGFQIERRGGTSAEFSQIGIVPANSTTYPDASVLPNTAYAYRVRAFNGTGISTFTNEAPVITPLTPSVLSIGTADLPDATVGVAYSRTLTAVGGKPDFGWLIESGSLPSGLSLAQTGSISGTPSAAGTFNFVVRVTDANLNSATKALTLVVKPAAPLTITMTQLPRGSVGTPYSQSIGASGGQTPYSWSILSGNLPEGLTLNQSGIISGTPERAVSTSFLLRLTDAVNVSVTSTLSLTINPAAQLLSIETRSLADGLIGNDYSQTLKAVGGTSPYRWELKGGKLPDGLALSEAGVISGVPTTTGEVSFEVQASDQSGQSVIAALSIDVDPPPELTILSPGALPVAAVGVPYRFEFKATSGTAPYFWVKKKKPKFGTLPDGLALSREGILSGTPTTQGLFNFTIIVNDSGEKQARKPLTLEVGPPPPPLAIRTEFLPQALQGIQYGAALEAAGGVGPYSWIIDTGTLPDGLTMATSGVISGRATTVGSTSFVVRVKDSLGTSSTKSLFLIVGPAPPPLVIQTVTLPETSAERPYNQSLQAGGGVPPYNWHIASGSLGVGLNLSASGVISGTPVSAGTSVFVVAVTDSAAQTVTRTMAITVKPADNLAPFGVLETPDVRATLNNTASGSGWALDNVGIARVEVLIDGQKETEAVYGLSRPDIAAVWGSSFPNAGHAGFSFVLDTTKFTTGEHILAVRLLDAAGNATLIGTRSVVFQNRVFTIISTDLNRGTKNQPYSMQLTAANGRPPYSWTLASGSLPSGLSLSVSGLISGTPTVFGTFPFVVRATDSSGATAIASLTLVVISDIEPLRIISNGPLDQGSTGVDYNLQLLFAGGVPPRTWAMGTGSLPAGLSLSTGGVISGKPTQVGTFTFTVRLTDSAPTTVTSQPLEITIVPGPLVIVTTGDLNPHPTAGSPYSFTLQKLGGASPYTWSVASGALPPGLSLNPSTGVISGTPTQYGTYPFTVTLRDSQPESVTSGTLRIIVDPAPLVITSSGDLPGGAVNVDYTQQLSATGGRTPYVWALAAGSLPPGLTLNTETGVISGRPTAGGPYSFTVRVTDSTPTTATSTQLRITISP